MQKEQTVTVRIPSGVEDGTRIQLRGQGEVGEAGGPSGDLYVELSVAHDDLYERAGDDLLTRVRIPMTSAALGTSVPLTTFDGEQDLEIKAGSQPGDVLTLKGLGVTALRSERRGDIKVELDVVVPKNLSGEEKELLRAFAAKRGEEAPRHQGRKGDGGVFGRLRDAFRER